jgi:hypothetical protein
LVVRPHYAEGLLDAQVKGAAHPPRDVPAKGTQATRQRAPGLRFAFLDRLAGLESSGPQLPQLLFLGVVGRAHGLGLGGCAPQGGPQA